MHCLHDSQIHVAKVSYAGAHVPMLVPRTNIGLSPTMGFLTENDSLAYFEIFSRGLSKTFDFLLILVGFSRGPGRLYLATL